MATRIIQINIDDNLSSLLENVLKKISLIDSWKLLNPETHFATFSILVSLEKTQEILDILQNTVGSRETTRIVVLPVATTLPKPTIPEEDTPNNKKKYNGISREELYDTVADGAAFNLTYIWLILLSTVVASIGLLENNIAVLIGAMVIAPMLGPNLALALSTSLGDLPLMLRSLRTNFIGIAICLTLAYIIGYFWPYGLHSTELILRTDVGYDGIVLAFASGTAAVLSLTTGLSSILVGVMVAVALLPPVTTIGIMLGGRDYHLALGATLLFAVNIVCVNLSANIVFMLQGIRPSKWYEQQRAKKARLWQLIFLITLLLVLAIVIYLRNGLIFTS